MFNEHTLIPLKPCPFCGGLAKAVNKHWAMIITCEACSADGAPCDSSEEAATVWNQRYSAEAKSPPTCPTCGGTTGFVNNRGTLDVCDDPWHDEHEAKQFPTLLTVETDADGRFVLNGHDVVWHSTYVRVVNQRDSLQRRCEELTSALRNLLVMLPSDAPEQPDRERIPAGFCYVRWQDIREGHKAIGDSP